MYKIDGTHKRILIWIPARGGSKGVPRKALKDLGGKPLIAHTIENALCVEGVDKVAVNTDDPEIRDVAIHFGAEVPFLRPSRLAGDDACLGDVFQHQYEWYKENKGFVADIHIGMSPTYPFRRRSLVNEALRCARVDSRIFNIRSVAPIFNQRDNFWRLKSGCIERFSFPNIDGFDQVPLYQNAFSFNIVMDWRNPGCNRITPFGIGVIESVDIDTPQDLAIARMLVAHGWVTFDEKLGADQTIYGLQ